MYFMTSSTGPPPGSEGCSGEREEVMLGITNVENKFLQICTNMGSGKTENDTFVTEI